MNRAEQILAMTPEQRTERYFTVVYKLTDANVAKYLSNRDWITYVYADSMAELANLKELNAEPAATQPAWLDLLAGVEAVGEMRASESLGVAPYADIWGWLQPGTKLYSATQVQAMLAAQAQPVTWPRNAAEVREFTDAHCQREERANDDSSPSDDDLYVLTAHDFLSAINSWADSPHHPGAAKPAQPRDDAVFVVWWSDHMPNSTEADAWAEWCALRSNQPTR